MTRFRRTSITCTLVVGLLALAACGGSNDSSSDGASDTAAPAEQSPTDTDDSDDATEAPVSTVGDVPGFSDECEAIVNFIGATGQILSGQIDAGRGHWLVDELLARVGHEIKADATGQAALAALENPEYDQATDTLGDHVAAECPIGG